MKETSRHKPVQSVVIVGGGTAGWIAAAALSKLMGRALNIRLIESEAIGTVGVGEATIPQIRRLNAILGIDERDFIAATQGTFKLGIEFNNWGQIGESYLHTFGDAGINLQGIQFHHYWLRHAAQNPAASLWDYSIHQRAAYAHKFAKVDRVGQTSMTGLAYAYHFDASLYARYLRNLSEALGVKRTEGRVVEVVQDTESGFISFVQLENGDTIDGDLFIDCTGFRSLLIGQALGIGYQDWSEWLPMDSAVTVATERTEPLLPYTKATAHGAGWQWRIPLQNRTGNGHVYCSNFIADDAAQDVLENNLDAPMIGEPRRLRFKTGRREQFWHKNVVSLGLSSGFLEPLESTSIHIIQSNVSRLIQFFPNLSFSDANIAEYNRLVAKEYELIRDFLILHYARTDRDDTPFWQRCRAMSLPDSLTHKLDLFESSAHLFDESDDLFRESSWVQVMLGQGVRPSSWHRHVDQLSEAQMVQFMSDVERLVAETVDPLPSHSDFIASHCAAATD